MARKTKKRSIQRKFNIVLGIIAITVWSLLINMWLTPKVISPLPDKEGSMKSRTRAYAQEIISPLPTDPVIPMATPTPTPLGEAVPEFTQGEIEAYIKTIFGSDARTAIAVSRAECSPANRTYPRCVATNAVEHSIGLFQINLQSRYVKVHYDRVPGETLAAKVAWLSEPHNNVLMAYWIFTKSGWGPWSSYNNGSFRNNL